MTPIFSNNTENFKSNVQNGTGVFCHRETILIMKTHLYRIKWRRVTGKEIQISRHMTIYGQNLGGFKHENNECIRNGETTKLHKIKIVVFFIWHVWCYNAYFVTFRRVLRHFDVILTLNVTKYAS